MNFSPTLILRVAILALVLLGFLDWLWDWWKHRPPPPLPIANPRLICSEG